MMLERKKFVYGEKDEKGNILIPGALSLGVSEEIAEKVFFTDGKICSICIQQIACHRLCVYCISDRLSQKILLSRIFDSSFKQ